MVTATAAAVEVEVLGECLRCGGEMTVAPVLHGIELAGGYLCDPCFFYVYNGSKAQALAALGLGPTEASADDDGDDDGPDGSPAAPAARPTLWLIVAGQSVPRELTPAEEAELREFIADCEASAPLPEPCASCGRPASPYQETPAGPLCLACADGGVETGAEAFALATAR